MRHRWKNLQEKNKVHSSVLRYVVRTYVLHWCVEQCAGGELKRLYHYMCYTLWG